MTRLIVIAVLLAACGAKAKTPEPHIGDRCSGRCDQERPKTRCEGGFWGYDGCHYRCLR